MTLAARWRLISPAAMLLAVLSGCVGPPDPPDSPPAAVIDEPDVPKQLQSRQIIVALPDRLRSDWAAIAGALQAQYRLRPVGEFPLNSIKAQCLVFQVPADQSLGAVIARLKTDPRVELAQPNQTFEGLQTVTHDPYAGLAYGAKLIRADGARRISTGQGVAVAVIDTGADLDHPDLRGRIAETATFVEGGEPSFHTDRHGTAVAGVIGAHADGAGFDGIAPQARLTVLKACWYPDRAGSKARCSSWSLAKAVDFATNHNVRVINLSLGGPPDDLLTRLLTAAHRRGVVVVAATLDNQDDPGFPASLDTAIPTLACDANRRIAPLRWRNVAFVAAAPGVDIVAPAPSVGYRLVSGSSLAAAHVTGLVALLLQQAPQLTPDQVKAVLRATATPIPGLKPPAASVVGLVDACAALARQAPSLACP